jgi:hypothetical protein
MTTLIEIAASHPFPDYQNWWEIGETFSLFMSEAITGEWRELMQNANLQPLREYAAHYIQVVYKRQPQSELVDNFVNRKFTKPFSSGEFDALSYAFFRSVFDEIADQNGAYSLPLAQARRHFTQRVGKKFFSAIHEYLHLDLPTQLKTDTNFARLHANIERVGHFLLEQGYLRNHFAFTFDVHVTYADRQIAQTTIGFLEALNRDGMAYALYEMSYPVILPSAVYLYHTLGEAQHHSSRTIEELFARVGCKARETDDFDPTGFPPDRVVELWEIRPY